jgi:integrase
MAIERMKDKPHGKFRKLPWRYRDRAKGVVRYFKTRKEAEEYQEENNSRKRRTGLGLPSTMKDLKRYTVRDVIRSYMSGNLITEDDELFEDEEALAYATNLPTNVYLALWSFSRREICDLSLFDFNAEVAEQYRDDRLKETWKPPGSLGEAKPISPRTVRWEISRIQLAWKMARKWQGLSNLQNPWEGIRVTGSTGGRRERSLEEGELERLTESCKGCLVPNRFYVPLAIFLGVETGMRRQEIFNLIWEDIDFEKKRIKIRKSKTDRITGNRPVDIVLPFMAKVFLRQLWSAMLKGGKLPEMGRTLVGTPGALPSGRLFPMTGEAFTQAFSDVVKRAKIEDLTFHDLRRTANTRFIKAGLSLEERNIMLRHADKSMNAVYIGRNSLLERIQEKLERHHFDGRTEEEVIRELAAEQGMTVEEAKVRGLKYSEQQLAVIRQVLDSPAIIRTSPPS